VPGVSEAHDRVTKIGTVPLIVELLTGDVTVTVQGNVCACAPLASDATTPPKMKSVLASNNAVNLLKVISRQTFLPGFS
jgi:hypothetical protein